MKKRNLIFVLIIVLLVGMMSCTPKGSTVAATLEIQDIENLPKPDSTISKAIDILKLRIEYSGIKKYTIERIGKTGKISIKAEGVKYSERFKNLLQAKGDFGLWETYKLLEIQPGLIEADQLLKKIIVFEDIKYPPKKKLSEKDSIVALLKGENAESTLPDSLLKKEMERENPLLVYLNQYGLNGDNAVVGIANCADTARINRYLQMEQVKALLPYNLLFVWGAKPIDVEGKYIELYSVKYNPNSEFALMGDIVTEASAQYEKHSSFATINIKMDAYGTQKWAQMTESNIGRPIAMIIDGKVYSAPAPREKIEGGSSQITGQFTAEEAYDFANILQSGSLPAPIKIIQFSAKNPNRK